MNQPITTPANLFAFVRDALQGFLGLAVCVGTLACPTAAKADSCEAVADQAIHAVLADENLSRPSNGGRVNLLYGLAFTSPHEFERVVRSPETSGLFRTPAIHTCERILRLLSRSFAPRPGDERELAEILARQRSNPSVARDSVQGSQQLAEMAEGMANLVLIAQRMTAGQALEPSLQSAWSISIEVAAFSRSALCNQAAQARFGRGQAIV